MSPSNKEMQLSKNCQLYAYLLQKLNKEVPETIQDCADDYEYTINCTQEFSREIDGLSSEEFEAIINDKESREAAEIRYWIDMRQEADRLHKMLSADT